jgi:tRNA nucleotidyltransferase (CCA-adding enzyme)
MMVIDMAARLRAPLHVRWACLMHDLGKGTTPLDVLPKHIGHEIRSVHLARAVAERFKVPTQCKELAEVVAREHANIHRSLDLNAAAVMRLLERCDAIRQPRRFEDVLLACECDARGRLGLEETAYPQRPHLLGALRAAQAVATFEIAKNVEATLTLGKNTGLMIGEAIARAREAAVKAYLADQQPIGV